MAKQNQKSIDSNDTNSTLEKVVGSSESTDSSKSVGADLKNGEVAASQIKDETTPKNVFNTKKVAELVSDGGTNASAGIASIAKANAVTFSGGADMVSGDKSATTLGTTPRKSGDRPGRTQDTAIKHIDDVPAESFRVPLHTIPQIHEGKSGVGYNGRYSNEHAVSQKGSGGTPASNKFFRTLDLIEYDNMYFTHGQLNEAENDLLEVANYNTTSKDYDSTLKQIQLGNYVHETCKVTFDNYGKVTNITFDVKNLDSYRNVDDMNETVNRLAGDFAIRNRNKAELDRLKMIQVAGDETKDNWSPLGEVILTSSDANRAMAELEGLIGDFNFISASKLSTALAYQLNKAAKDGQRKIAPMYEMCNGNIDGSTVRHTSSRDVDHMPMFEDAFALSQGSSALYVAINDTVRKYNSKGKLLSLPLSFKTALETSSKNRGKLKMHNTLYDEFNRQEVFGKIDEDGSGMTPYFITDGAGLITPININSTYTFDSNTGSITPIFTLHYEDLRNRYNEPVYNYFVQGLVDYFNRKGGNIVKQLTNNGTHYSTGYTDEQLALMYPDKDHVMLTIPMVSTTTCISLWDLIVCAAAKDVAIHRQYAMHLVLRYVEKNGNYPYSDLIDLESVNIGGSTNVGFTDISTPLSTRNIPLATATRILLPEVFSPKFAFGVDDALLGGNYNVAKVIMPWYFNENGFIPTEAADGKGGSFWGLSISNGSSMTTFDTRGGVSFGNMDRINSLDPEQLRLYADRMVDIPGRHALYSNNGYSAMSYKYSQSDDGMLVCTYCAYATDKNRLDYVLSIGDILAAPRELGLSFIAPAGVVTPAFDGTDQNYRSFDSSYIGLSGPSFRCKYWHSATNVSNTLFEDNLDSDYAVNFSATYDCIEATANRGNTDIGITLTANQGSNTIINATYSPFMIVTGDGTYDYTSAQYEDGQTPDTVIKLQSALKYLYTRVNILPFIVNPFDSNTYVFTSSVISKGGIQINSYDDYDFLHIYNVCGFRCGEYSGTEYDRTAARIQEGLAYVDDPYISKRS